ncbi:MAG: hypothetical protein CTY12_00835 [Methylotenera sp.]|nr:MAG: hypothetical protein CTY12_00835 [Methylotenera sp.]
MSKEFKPTYLYVKTHNVTGLKYFGKTCKDPYVYRGSGIYWLRHLRQHGNDVSTEVIGLFEDRDECVRTALLFSETNNIVHAINESNKKIWANQIIENGLDGGVTRGWIRTPEYRERMSNYFKGRIVSESTRALMRQKRANQDMSHMRRPKTEEWKQRISESSKKRQPMSSETKQKMSDNRKGKSRSDETKRKISMSRQGFKHTEESLQKMRGIPCSDEKKQRLRELNIGKIISIEVKQKLKGYICVINIYGHKKRIPLTDFYSQLGDKTEWEWVAHNSHEGKHRKSNAVPVIDEQQMIDISRMRRG